MARGKKAARRQYLRELIIRKAQPEARAYLIWDTKQTHLALQVHPTGSKSWYCIYSRRGRSRWYHIGDAAVIGLADARTIAAEVMLDVVPRGRDPAAEKSHRYYLAEVPRSTHCTSKYPARRSPSSNEASSRKDICTGITAPTVICFMSGNP